MNIPQPPQIEDPLHPEVASPSKTTDLDDEDWLERAQDAFRTSTSYLDSNYRKSWEDSIRAFNNQHALDSKYNSALYDKRSKVYRPKIRSVIRKNEAAAASAFFSNVDVISTEAVSQGDQKQVISAEIMKHLLQYRLTKSIPWFQVILGGVQDAQVQGIVCAHVWWNFKRQDGEIVHDKPVVELIPAENLRIDPGASWMDPIGTSPYIIHLMPMYVGDVKDRMSRPDPKGRKWKKLPDATIRSAMQDTGDSTNAARNQGRESPYQNEGAISDYDIVWVHRHIHRYKGEDFEFFMLADHAMLTDPEPLVETVFHGLRPYVMGCSILETHKVMPTSVPMLGMGLQNEANEVANQRLDNVKFVLNKAYFVRRGKNVDVGSLVRNVPGRVTMMDDPETDVKESSWPDVTASAYEEQNRISTDMDELLGNFSPSSIQASGMNNAPVKGAQMLPQTANSLTEYMLRTFVETFVLPVLYQLVKLEQHYETDDVVLSIAAERAQVWQRYGISRVTDELLDQDLTINVNVGMGATDPAAKMAKFTHAIGTYAQIARLMPPGLNMTEVMKELMGLSGYQDGRRFLSQDPAVAAAQKQLQMLKMQNMQLMMEKKNKEGANVVKLQTAREKNAVTLEKTEQDNKTKLAIAGHKEHHENARTLATLMAPALLPQPEVEKKSA